jgi:hypothetical protein
MDDRTITDRGALLGIAVHYWQEGLPDEADVIQIYIEQWGTALHIEMKTFGWGQATQ